jgi:hypothetical protein
MMVDERSNDDPMHNLRATNSRRLQECFSIAKRRNDYIQPVLLPLVRGTSPYLVSHNCYNLNRRISLCAVEAPGRVLITSSDVTVGSACIES